MITLRKGPVAAHLYVGYRYVNITAETKCEKGLARNVELVGEGCSGEKQVGEERLSSWYEEIRLKLSIRLSSNTNLCHLWSNNHHE